jgi:aryl-alcohol dehydrogenase-like predicted oxidoreductase
MERRPFGTTGEKVSVIGFGGIICMNEEPSAAKKLVSQAVDRGISYFDVAPSYGNSEERLGPALAPYRKKVFLACKTGKRTAAEADAELASSLALLKTDHLDLYQHHAVTTLEEVETIMGPGGAMETFVKARAKGMVRLLGFSAHTEEAALALMDRFAFDSVLFPFTWACWLKSGFGEKVLAKAEKKGMARLALKTLAKRKWAEGEEKSWAKCWYKPVDTYEEAVQAVRFTLSKPVTAAVSPGHAELLWWMCDAAEHARPLSAHEEEALAEEARALEAIFPQ